MDERHAGGKRIRGRRKPHGLPIEPDLAGVGRQHAAQDVHQRGFARAVFADQRVDLARPNAEVDAFEHDILVKLLAYAAHFQFIGRVWHIPSPFCASASRASCALRPRQAARPPPRFVPRRLNGISNEGP